MAAKKFLFAFAPEAEEVAATVVFEALRWVKSGDVAILLCVFDTTQWSGWLGGLGTSLESEIKEQADALLNTIKDTLSAKQVECITEVASGSPREVVCARAEAYAADCVVLAPRGLGRMERLLHGSVCDYVLQHSPQTVMVVDSTPCKRERGTSKKILCCVDTSPPSKLAFFEALKLACKGDTMHILSVVEDGRLTQLSAEVAARVDTACAREIEAVQATTQVFEALCAKAEVQCVVSCLRGEPRTIICDQAREFDVDVVVVGSRGLGPVATLLLGSVATHVVRSLPAPAVMVVKPGSKAIEDHDPPVTVTKKKEDLPSEDRPSEPRPALPCLSATATAVEQSAIREVMMMAGSVPNCIRLEVGQPDFATPPHVVEAACAALRGGDTRYIPNAGTDALRLAVAEHFTRTTGVPTTVSQVMATPGAVNALAVTFMALLDPGDSVLLPEPGWPNYRQQADLIHAHKTYYPTKEENGYVPRASDIAASITPRTRVLLLCSPSNPTGAVIPAKEMAAIMEVARAANVWVVSDEIYGAIVFDGTTHVSAAAHDSDGRAVVISGVSKAYAMTGFRVGFLRAREEIVRLVTKLQEPLVSCGVASAQAGAVAALSGPQECVAEMRAAYSERRDMALGILKANGRFTYAPGGAFYLMVDIGRSGLSSWDFVRRLIREKQVSVTPGATFGPSVDNCVRVSFASPKEELRKGMEKICELIAECELERKGKLGS